MKKNRSIFITGGASGIGKATVIYFYQKGWNVGFIDIDKNEAESLLASLGDPKEVSFFLADVRDYDTVLKAVKSFVKTYGDFNAVFANAGIHMHADILSTSFEKWKDIIDINITGVFHTIKATLPILISRGKGSIVMMGSDQSLVAKKNSFAYGASKGAVGQMTKNLALDYARYNIRVNCVCPATIDTPLAKKTLQAYADKYYEGDLDKVLRMEASEFPLERIGEAEEVAKTVYFLASDKASYITGVLLPIDGGYTAK